MRAVAALVLGAILAIAGVGAVAVAAPASTVIQGTVIRLESVQDAAAMTTMEPNAPVAWDVGVSASQEIGTIDVSLEVEVDRDAYAVVVRACDAAWTTTGCSSGEVAIVEGDLDSGVLDLGAQPAATPRWYRVEVELLGFHGGATASLVFRASGAGESVASGGDLLPPTGGPSSAGLALGVLAVTLGVAVACMARLRRTEPR